MPLPEKVCFGVFELDTGSGELRKQGSKVRLQHQSFQVLVALLERPGAVVTREVLRQKLWPSDTYVNFDNGLSSAIRKLREALGDSAESPRFVETLPKRGYRFIAAVDRGDESSAPPIAPTGAVVDEGATAQQTASSRLRRRTVLAATALLVLAAALGVGLSLGSWRDRLWELHPAQIRSIAVLPFENLTGDAAEDRLVEAVADSLTTELVRARLLEIASRTSAARLSDARGGVPEIAQRLNVDAVVEGSVSRLGQRWLVNVQLIQGSSDRHVWAERYERETGELSTLPGEVAWEMLRAIPPDLQPPNERGAAHRRPANEQAYDAYVLGRHLLWKRTAESVATAISVFEQSIAYDPAYGPAYSGLSDAYRNDATFTQDLESYPKAEDAARKALELDENLAEAHTSLGGILWRYWKWDDAERELRRALELDPTYAEGYRVYGQFLHMQRRLEESVAALRQAHELDRLSLTIRIEYANALSSLEHHDEALRELERARELDPQRWRVYQSMAIVHAARGDWSGAIDALQQDPGYRSRPPNPWLGYYYAAAGRRVDALEILHRVEAQAEEGKSLGLGILHWGLGNKETALDLIEQGVRERRGDIMTTTALYRLLKGEPRYQAMLREMGLSLSDTHSAGTPKSAK